MEYRDVVYARRAINFFDPEKNVTDEQLKQVLSLAAQAPSGFNLQPWNLMVLRETEEKKKLQELAWGQPKVSEAPVTLIFLADTNGWQEGNPTLERNWREMTQSGAMNEEQRDWFLGAAKSLYGSSGEAAVAFAAKNTAFFAMAVMYAAVSLGLESHPMDGFDQEGVKKAFNIPDHYWLPLLLAVGYPKPGLELSPPKWRKTPEETIVSFL